MPFWITSHVFTYTTRAWNKAVVYWKFRDTSRLQVRTFALRQRSDTKTYLHCTQHQRLVTFVAKRKRTRRRCPWKLKSRHDGASDKAQHILGIWGCEVGLHDPPSESAIHVTAWKAVLCLSRYGSAYDNESLWTCRQSDSGQQTLTSLTPTEAKCYQWGYLTTPTCLFMAEAILSGEIRYKL